jgi:hypothetical protein
LYATPSLCAYSSNCCARRHPSADRPGRHRLSRRPRGTGGCFFAQATFVLYGAPLGYREAYGIFVGRLDLGEPDQEYTYLLIRSTGDFLVKRRIGVTGARSLDALHLGTAKVVGGGALPFVTFDLRQAQAARALGWFALGS